MAHDDVHIEHIETMSRLKFERDILSLKKEIDHLTSHAENAMQEKRKNSLKMDFDILDQEHRNKKQRLEHTIELMKLEKDKSELEFEIARQKITHQSDLINAEIILREKELAEREWASAAIRMPDPILLLDSGAREIIVSDRIIDLNGVITYRTADYISTRLNYYNNQSMHEPIFLVIGNSPGGSVMAGLEILANIENSRAPIYTIIKSFAASMAAVIATRTNSYMYKDANILHHQMWCFTVGNISWHEEQTKYLKELSQRTDGPMLEKINTRLLKLSNHKSDESDTNSYTESDSYDSISDMPVLWTQEEWTKAINSKNMSHEWMVHGDEAAKLGWVEACVTSIRFTSQVRHPDAKYSIEKSIPAAPSPPPPTPCKGSSVAQIEHFPKQDETLRTGDYLCIYEKKSQ